MEYTRLGRTGARRDEVVIAAKVYGRMRSGPNGAGPDLPHGKAPA
ncbi:hypothetical protein [Acidisphaera sp. S103]|nr:hypothetical protein [Acidisphaera sp. S103]